jgi:uncharacterized phage protein gp47/JayE
MPTTQTQLALQMVAQLRLLDPSVSAEVGTPERKILDTVGSALYDNQVDLEALRTGLSLDGKYGAQLDRFLALFGFTRQQATFATGFVTFSRPTASTSDIRIPAGSTVRANSELGLIDGSPSEVRFTTTYDVILPAGSLSVVAPVRATLPGSFGNVAAQRINEIVGSTIFGITTVTNELATSGGSDFESDAEYKTRFKNTVFRNLAGTQDQYLALAIATNYSTRANVIGPQSHYREYVQVPFVDDSSSYDVDGNGSPEAGGGLAGEYTTALSTIPYAKSIWTNLPAFLSNGEIGAATIFYRSGADFRMNSNAARDAGDTHRQLLANIGPDPAAGILPNITLVNVYTGDSADVQAVSPGDVVLFEFTYLSNASRNEPTLGITNAVDVYIDGGNETLASTVTVRPKVASAFVDNVASKYHYENYRRVGQPTKRPIIGNVLMPLFWEPVTDVPDQVIVGTTSYLKGVHYWPIYDISDLQGTVRARNGIEWSTTVFGKATTDIIDDPSGYTGVLITDTTGDPSGGQPVEVEDYTFDKNIVDLQASLDGSRQITTDVLAHRAVERYFKLDVTVMYTPGVNVSDTNSTISDAVNNYLQSLYFGSVVQLSDLLQIIHNVSGVDNVRWSTDVPNSADLLRVQEVDINGQPLAGVTTERIQPGNATRPEIQALFIDGQIESGSFTLTYGTTTSAALTFNTTAAAIQTALNTLGLGTVTVTEDTRSTTGVTVPSRSFRITWTSPATGSRLQIVPQASFIGGPYIYESDFFLRDNELARLPENVYVPPTGTPDSVAGLIIRPRAQNTFNAR